MVRGREAATGERPASPVGSRVSQMAAERPSTACPVGSTELYRSPGGSQTLRLLMVTANFGTRTWLISYWPPVRPGIGRDQTFRLPGFAATKAVAALVIVVTVVAEDL